MPNRIIKVHHRLILVNELITKLGNADNRIQTITFPGLITYLLLTCFDQLGQPTPGWIDFSGWLKSKRTKTEVDSIIDSLKSKGLLSGHIRESMLAIHKEYQNIYGVKHSFFRFVNEVLPAKMKKFLLDNIKINREAKDGVELEERTGEELNELKLKWLYATRNDYTHSLNTVESNISHGYYIGKRYWSFRNKNNKKDYVEIILVPENFIDILIVTIRIGALNLVVPDEIEKIIEENIDFELHSDSIVWFDLSKLDDTPLAEKLE